MMGWIGVDLDGTLARYDGWQGIEHVGEPIPAMMERVKRWLSEGREVRIFTARCHEPAAVPHIEAWLAKHGLAGLAVTNVKDFAMDELWDDRVVRVEANTGSALCASPRGLDGAAPKSHVDRMAAELQELTERVTKLYDFMMSEGSPYQDLPDDEKALLNTQGAAMMAYQGVLQMRFDRAIRPV